MLKRTKIKISLEEKEAGDSVYCCRFFRFDVLFRNFVEILSLSNILDINMATASNFGSGVLREFDMNGHPEPILPKRKEEKKIPT